MLPFADHVVSVMNATWLSLTRVDAADEGPRWSTPALRPRRGLDQDEFGTNTVVRALSG